MKNMIMNKEITIMTKKTKKETSVFVSDVWENEKIIVGWYKNKFGELTIKHFDMTKYDFYL